MQMTHVSIIETEVLNKKKKLKVLAALGASSKFNFTLGSWSIETFRLDL